MDFTFLKLDVADRVAIVTIDRQDKLNALNAQVINELDRMFADLAARADVGVSFDHNCTSFSLYRVCSQ